MRTILLSFSPSYYDILKNGQKVFEYRKRFCNEKVKAYLYLGKPIQKIVGILWLDKRIELSKWKELYKGNLSVSHRIDDYMQRNKYAMPILRYQEINPISIVDVKKVFPELYIPLSFRNLEENSDILKYLQDRTKFLGEVVTHNFENIDIDRICEM